MQVSYDKEMRQKAKKLNSGLLTLSTTTSKGETIIIQSVFPDNILEKLTKDVLGIIKVNKQ